EGYAAHFAARALEETFRVGERLVEIQTHPARIDRKGDDALVPTLGRTERHHERAGIVVNELIATGESPAEFGQAPCYQGHDLWREPRQERGKLCLRSRLAIVHRLTLPHARQSNRGWEDFAHLDFPCVPFIVTVY